MKERPILFSAEMVRAILDGRKIQTRRVITSVLGYKELIVAKTIQDPQEALSQYPAFRQLFQSHCPYGQPGDRLWVRETFKHIEYNGGPYIVYRADGDGLLPSEPYFRERFERQKWTPSIFMPRYASRIDLEIERVRVEQVQDISEKDAYAEGIDLAPTMPHPKAWFRDLWDSINAKRGYSWASNPWVWVVEFRRVDR